ncbi:hypothetical protein [Nonomuraea sp. KM88]|uniref:hypothetical protein n=1 Tax=Nonomuraea sp. KM88 TaxID=3457427 RepID=UPI003FCCB2C2
MIDDMLRADLDAPRKQRHTAKRIFTRLVDEHQAAEVSYQMVRAYVAQRRAAIRRRRSSRSHICREWKQRSTSGT